MLRTARQSDIFDHPRIVALALASLALATTSACGNKVEEAQGEPAVVSSPVVPTSEPGETVGSESPVPVEVTFAEAESAFNKRRYDEATEMFTAYVLRRPDNAYGHYMLGLSSWKSGHLDRAKQSFERSLELDSNHVKTLLNLSRVLLEQDRPNEALVRVNAALALDSSNEVHRTMARVRAALKQYDSALESYRFALVLDPRDTWSMNNLGLFLLQLGRDEEAIGPLALAVQLRPSSPVFQNNLGIALERGGHYVSAAAAFRAALAADSNYRKAAVSLARVEGSADDPHVFPIELAAEAEAFGRAIHEWRGARSVTVDTTTKTMGARPPEK